MSKEEALKAFEQMLSEIDRDNWLFVGTINPQMVEWAIKALKGADRPQEWIPCSERLPKENTEVLISLEWGIDIGEYRNGDWHSEWINHYDDDDVLAWMPLPKPWKGADDESN